MKEKLLKLRERWKITRESYPGWIVAPRDRREALWVHTQYWADPIVQNLNTLPLPYDLLLLRELIWRFERIMVPLLTVWIPQFDAVLRQYDLAAQKVNGQDGKSQESMAATNWVDIQEAWVSVAFALLRNEREDLEAESFAARLGQLVPIVGGNDDWSARWHYENCLWSLWQCNAPVLRQHLSAWRPPEDQPTWLARKAAISAELGDVSEAAELADEALRLLREPPKDEGQNFANLSQEGWTLCLRRALARNINEASGAKNEDYRHRWNRLNEARCNPWPELEACELALESRDAPIRAFRKIHRGFDLGRFHETHHIGSNSYEPLIPAFSLLRLFEEAGLPMRVEGTAFVPTAVANAAAWLWEAMPYGSVSALLRIRDSKNLDNIFQRWKVAVLDESKAKRLCDWLMQIVSDIANDPPAPNPAQQNFSSALISPAIELFSRLTIRMSQGMLRAAFDLASRMYKATQFRAATWRREPMERLFRRTMEAADSSLLAEWLPDLVRLPLVSNDFPVAMPEIWFDPLSTLPIERCREAIAATNREALGQAVEILLTQVAQSTGFTRQHGIQRLSVLHLADGLPLTQDLRFATVLWSRLNPDTGLPAEAVDRISLVLHLPSPSGIDRKERVANALLVLSKRRTLQNGGQNVQSIPPESNYFRQLWEASYKPLLGGKIDALIDWSEAEAVEHLKLCMEWWDSEKNALLSNTSAFLGLPDSKQTFSRLPDVLANIVLPRLSVKSKDSKASAQRMITDLAERGFNILDTFPAQISVGLLTPREVVPKFLRALHSSRDDIVRDALHGLSIWAAAVWVSGRIKKMPVPLVNAVVGKAEFRREPALPSTFDLLGTWLELDGDWLGPEQIAQLVTGLEMLLEDADLHLAPKVSEEDTLNYVPLRQEDIPACRMSVVAFAAKFAGWIERRGQPQPEVLVRWKAAALSDPLPEIRRAWKVQSLHVPPPE